MPWNEEVLSCVQTNDQGWVTYDSYIALWLYVNTLLFPRGTLSISPSQFIELQNCPYLLIVKVDNAEYWGIIFGRFKILFGGYEFSSELNPD